MMYFTHLASNNAPGNKLQREALAVLKAQTNLLINNKDAFIAALRSQIDKLNADNPRCTALSVYVCDGTSSGSTGISLGNYTVNFRLHPVKNGGQGDA